MSTHLRPLRDLLVPLAVSLCIAFPTSASSAHVAFGPVRTVVGGGAGSAVVTDFDRDGHPDIAWLASTGTGTVSVFRQTRPLRFELSGTSTRWPDGGVLDVADIDGDGAPDLLASPTTSGFSWALNRGAR